MYTFMHGADCEHYDHLSQVIEKHATSESPFLIPSVIIRFNLEYRTESLNHWHDRLYWHERNIGIRFDDHYKPNVTELDYSTLSKNLNAANTRIAYTVWACKATARQLDFMDLVAARYREQAIRKGLPEDRAFEVEASMVEEHANLRAWNEGIIDRAEFLSKRGQALVQTVYSGIAQRDSAVSLSLAGTSTKLAKSSQEVAIATSRDSAVMRVIAAITIFFLPATFTAVSAQFLHKACLMVNEIQTFFSTTFFEFNANLNGRVYSHWLWLYFVVTVALTAAVVIGTWYLWKTREKQVEERFIREDFEKNTIFPVPQEEPSLTLNRSFEGLRPRSPQRDNI